MTDIAAAMHTGELTVVGRMPWSSNYTFLVDVNDGNDSFRAVYKPEQGEQPLRDFPPSLYRREVAAFEFATALGFPRIPVTITREDAPFGAGSLQHFINADYEQHYFTLISDAGRHAALVDIAVFDVLANNADRKAGHCLAGNDGEIYAIDNGLCFHEEPKLRTVIWDFGGQQISDRHLEAIEKIRADLPNLRLSKVEGEALRNRIETLLEDRILPVATSEYQFPWPLV